jgi:hypothetical protein
LKDASKFLMRELRCNEKKVAEEYCWGWAVMLQAVKFKYGVWNSTGLPCTE